jgi:spore germination cell wall hydrolase CwlJ-like protein
MNFRKYLLCLIIGVLVFNVSNIKAYAAEETKQEAKEASNNYTKAELRLLTGLIYCEAQGESYNGKLAVGIVVMNRTKSDRYPDTVKEVIYQKYQFSPVTNGTLKKALAEYDKGNFTSSSEKECIKAAKAALNGTKNVTVNGKKKSFSKYLSFSGRLKGYTYKLGNHQFK